MKTIVTASYLFVALLFASYGNNSNEQKSENSTNQIETAMYQCPIKCEDDKMYDKDGTCPPITATFQLLCQPIWFIFYR